MTTYIIISVLVIISNVAAIIMDAKVMKHIEQ